MATIGYVTKREDGRYDGELRTEGVPMLTDSYSPTEAMQHLGR